MLNSIWSKISAALGVLAGFFYFKSKLQENKIENLEEENAHHVKKDEIQRSTSEAAIYAEEKENEAKANFDDSDWRNNI